jgi:hypothetical protein
LISVLDPFGAGVVQENPYGPFVGGEGEELGIAKVDPADIVWFEPLGLSLIGGFVPNENPFDGVGALVTKEDSDDGLGVLVKLAPVGALVKLTTLGDGLGALVELAPNPDDGLGAFDANEDPDDGLGALVKLAPTVGLLVLVPTHLSA